jgi:replicative superfamily II helicase
MDTGSGKTQVAVLRIQAELAKPHVGKIVWFLAPTIALCSQQHDVLQSQITGVLIKILSGNDGVDSWSDVSIWDAFLKNVSIVVSTYQVLLDALSHAFVRVGTLSLIVFDEGMSLSPGPSPEADIYQPTTALGNIPVAKS